MSLKKFLKSRVFLINLLLAVVLVILLLIIALSLLKSYTRHSESYHVPDFAGMNFEQTEKLAAAKLLRVEITDSVYTKNMEPGVVVDQIPEAGKKVKEGRMIYLTVNALEPEKVKLPKLTDISFRQAKVLLENCGLSIESITYEPSEYNDLVLHVLQNSTEVSEGDMLVKGSSVMVIVGQSKGNMETSLPDLNGLFLEEARSALTEARLNMGVIIYDPSIVSQNDSLNARVWKQMPDSRMNQKVYLGSSVDLWLSVDPEKLSNKETPEQNQ